MSIELAILKLFCDNREIEISHYGYIENTENIERELKILFNLVHSYYSEYGTNKINKDELLSFFDITYPKSRDRAMCIDLINTAFALELNENLIRSSLDQFIEKHISTTIINKLIPVMEGSKFGILDTIQTDIESYRDLLFNPPDKLTIPKPCDLSVKELIEQEIMDEGLEWHLPTLNQIIGGLRMKRLGLIYAYVDCYSEDTEILTNKGWKYFYKLNKNDLVAQYSDNQIIEFVKPESYIKRSYHGVMYHIHDTIGRYDQLVTPRHRVIYRRNKLNIEEELARNIILNQTQSFDCAGIKQQGKQSLSMWERFLIAYQADGSSWRKGCDGSKCGHFTVRFDLKKKRKIERLKWILNNLKLKNYFGSDRKTWYIEVPIKISKLFDWVNLEKVSYKWCQEFIYELSHWDSHRNNHGIICYSSQYKYNVDIVQSICVLGYFSTNYHLQPKMKENHNDQHKLNIRIYQLVNGVSLIKDRILYNGNIYCVKVPSGKIIVRRNNKPCVSGNSGKTSFSLSSASHFAKQLIGSDENICYAGNEEDASRLKLRLIQAILSCTRSQIPQIENIDDKLKELEYINIFDDITTGEQIQYIIKEYNPSILYIDQATDIDIKTKRKREGVDYFKSLFKWYRKLAVKNNLAIIGISQGVGTAEQTKWLKLSDIYGSRVAIQGALDFAIGIGRVTDDPIVEDFRYINIPKNKGFEGDDGRFAVKFKKQQCLWEGL